MFARYWSDDWWLVKKPSDIKIPRQTPWYDFYRSPRLLGANTKVVILVVSIPIVQVHLTVVRVPVDTGNVDERATY